MSGTAHTGLNALAVLVSMLFLWKGAGWVVDSSARIARRLGVSELVIGLTLVALGTSAPEFAVSIGAALNGQADISVGNVVGSNVFNLGFILGGCAAIRPILTTRALVYRDGVFLVFVTILLAFFIGDFQVSRFEGIVMIALLVSYLTLLFWKRVPLEEIEHDDDGKHTAKGDIMWVLLGLVAVVGGSKLLVWGAAEIARTFGLSEWAIGVTIVAAGTSAPEVVTSLNAAIKGRHGISAGGLLGSDLYNLLGVLGVAAVISPLAVTESAKASVLVLVGMVMVVVVFLRTGWLISRWEAAALLSFNAIRWYAEMTGMRWF